METKRVINNSKTFSEKNLIKNKYNQSKAPK